MRRFQPGREILRDRVEYIKCPTANIGYLKTYKCASTFYNGLLVTNGWERKFFSDIDWQNDYVFSFIMNPFIRHIKGLAEDISGAGIEKMLLNNMGRAFWDAVPWIGFHSMPISVMLQDASDKINWLPMDAVEFTGEELLTQLLAKYNVTLDWSVDVYRHESSKYNKLLFDQLLDMSSNKLDYFKLYCRDFEIYDNAYQALGLTPRRN